MLGDTDQENGDNNGYRSTNMTLLDQNGGTDQEYWENRVYRSANRATKSKKGLQITDHKIEKIEGTDQPQGH